MAGYLQLSTELLDFMACDERRQLLELVERRIELDGSLFRVLHGLLDLFRPPGRGSPVSGDRHARGETGRDPPRERASI